MPTSPWGSFCQEHGSFGESLELHAGQFQLVVSTKSGLNASRRSVDAVPLH
jgi:hypothetical protein